MTATHADCETIEREVEDTRARVDQTLNALQARLSPGQMLDQAWGYFRDNGSTLGNNLTGSIRDNPLPVLLTGVGLAWLMMTNGASRERQLPEVGSAADDLRRTKESAGSALGGVKENVASGLDRARSAMAQMREKASGARRNLGSQFDSATQGMTEQARRARQGASRMMSEQPLAAGAFAFAVGALIGASLPETQVESRFAGQASRSEADVVHH